MLSKQRLRILPLCSAFLDTQYTLAAFFADGSYSSPFGGENAYHAIDGGTRETIRRPTQAGFCMLQLTQDTARIGPGYQKTWQSGDTAGRLQERKGV